MTAKEQLDKLVNRANWYCSDVISSDYEPCAKDNQDLADSVLSRLEELEKKETPMKPKMTDSGYYACKCTQRLQVTNYCPQCGVLLDWSDEK